MKQAQDRNQSHIQFHAEKRKLLQELNKEENLIMKLKKFDKDAVKLHKHEVKKA